MLKLIPKAVGSLETNVLWIATDEALVSDLDNLILVGSMRVAVWNFTPQIAVNSDRATRSHAVTMEALCMFSITLLVRTND